MKSTPAPVSFILRMVHSVCFLTLPSIQGKDRDHAMFGRETVVQDGQILARTSFLAFDDLQKYHRFREILVQNVCTLLSDP